MDSNLFISTVIVFLSFAYSLPMSELYEGNTCKLENGKTGVCKKINNCPSRVQEVLEGKRSSDSLGRCGFENFTEIVCCQQNITNLGSRPAEIACQQYKNEIKVEKTVQFNIYGGTEARPQEFPYMVALGYRNLEESEIDTEPIKYNCGGTLISSQHVLTAAHCVNNINEQIPIEVFIGGEDLTKRNGGVQRIGVSNVVSHSRFRRSAFYHDVAILKLETPVTLGNNIKPICLQTRSIESMDIDEKNVSFVVIGWGEINDQTDRSQKLMKTPSLNMVDLATCNKSYQDFGKLPRGLDENMLCLQDKNLTRRADACHGDSGGPLLMLNGSNHTIVGITAFGQFCAEPIPGVYTKVYSYLQWIEEQVWPEMIDER